jgi:integrase
MAKRQRGSVQREPSGRYGARWLEEHRRRYQGGFETRSDAEEWLEQRMREVRAVQLGERLPQSDRPRTVDELLDVFLAKHGRTVERSTLRTLETRLRKARDEFGDRHPDSLRRIELEDWRALLPPGSGPDVFRSFRQALAWGHARGLVERDASAGIRNPKRRRHERREVQPFETWAEVEAVAAELDPRYRAIPILLAGAGLRPEEAFGLHRADLDRGAALLRVERRYSDRTLKPGGKTPGSVRTVPLRRKVLDALEQMPPRIDTPILFPAPRGGYIDIEKFRYRHWAPALRAAGLPYRRIYDCRHTFATWAIEAGVELWYLARIMGSSVAQIEDTYARWLKRTDAHLIATLDAYDEAATAGGGL